MAHRIFDHIDDAKQYFGEDFPKAKQCKSCGFWAMPWNVDESGEMNPHTELCDLCAEGYC